MNEQEAQSAKNFIKEVDDTLGVYDKDEYKVLVTLVEQLEGYLEAPDLGAVMMSCVAIKERVDELLSSASKSYAVVLVRNQIEDALVESTKEQLQTEVADLQKED